MSLDHLWAGWRMAYVSAAGADHAQPLVGALGDTDCVFCAVLAADAPDEQRLVVWRGEASVAMLNAYPYASGHLMVMPSRHVQELGELEAAEESELWGATRVATGVLKEAYSPDGFNVGLNLGRAAGAGIPGHLHVHVVPRWVGDANFMTATASTRILPEALPDSWRRIKGAWSQ